VGNPAERQDQIALQPPQRDRPRANASRWRSCRRSIDRRHRRAPDTFVERPRDAAAAIRSAGTITAGNSSPGTDGASAVLLMSEKRARQEGGTPLAFNRGHGIRRAASERGLLMARRSRCAPARAHRTAAEGHRPRRDPRGFAAQVLATPRPGSKAGKVLPPNRVIWDRVNVNGSSISVGHPWSDDRRRILTTLANEMARRNARYGLISMCDCGRDGRRVPAYARMIQCARAGRPSSSIVVADQRTTRTGRRSSAFLRHLL